MVEVPMLGVEVVKCPDEVGCCVEEYIVIRAEHPLLPAQGSWDSREVDNGHGDTSGVPIIIHP